MSLLCFILKLLSPHQKQFTPSQVLNQGYPSMHTALKWWWCYFKYRGLKINELKMLSAFQGLITPQGKHIPNQINLGSKTFWNILQSTIVWWVLKVLMNNAVKWKLPWHGLQGKGKGKDSAPKPYLFGLSQKEHCLPQDPSRTQDFERGHGETFLLVIRCVMLVRQFLSPWLECFCTSVLLLF
jgi:hypothetical protein